MAWAGGVNSWRCGDCLYALRVADSIVLISTMSIRSLSRQVAYSFKNAIFSIRLGSNSNETNLQYAQVHLAPTLIPRRLHQCTEYLTSLIT